MKNFILYVAMSSLVLTLLTREFALAKGCGPILEAAPKVRTTASYRKEYLQELKKIKEDGTSFNKLIRQRRSRWKGSPQSVPVPEFRSLVNYLASTLIETKAELLPTDRRLSERQKYLDWLVQDAKKINSDPRGPAYDKTILFVLRASEGFEFLDNFNGAPIESDILKIALKGPIIPYFEYRINLAKPDDFILPAPVEMGYRSTSRLWAHRVFILASGRDLHAGESRRLFTLHDVFHFDLALQSKQKPLSDEEVDAFLEKLDIATNNIDENYLKKYGLSKNDLPVFLQVLDVTKFQMIHEPNISVENPPTGRPNSITYDAISLLTGEIYRAGIAVGEKPDDFLRAAIDWCNDFWRKNAKP